MGGGGAVGWWCVCVVAGEAARRTGEGRREGWVGEAKATQRVFAAGRQTMVFGAAEYLLKRVYRFALLRLLGPLLEGELSVEQLDVSISGGALELRDIALDAGYLNALLAGSDVEGMQVRATRTSLRGCALARTLASARPRAAH